MQNFHLLSSRCKLAALCDGTVLQFVCSSPVCLQHVPLLEAAAYHIGHCGHTDSLIYCY